MHLTLSRREWPLRSIRLLGVASFMNEKMSATLSKMLLKERGSLPFVIVALRMKSVDGFYSCIDS
jgi:hypothetical protein